MELGENGVTLRVLYTVNTSPQYILAKAPEKIALIPTDVASGSNSPPRHGRASAKACAMAICRSSPELRPDMSKDFSVYVLDPLEDFVSQGRRSQSEGVAVGMGLLSDILSPRTPDTSMVTGTIVVGQRESALEVVISLRQVSPSIMATEGGKTFLTDESRMPYQFNSDPASGSSKSSSKRPIQHAAQAISSHPLRSFDESLFESYAQFPAYNPHMYGSNSAVSGGYHDRRLNPSHFTRAHKLPTPYIGPPKRKYGVPRKRNQKPDSASSRENSAGPSGSQSNTICESTLGRNAAGPSGSQESSTSPEASTPIPPFSQQSGQPSPGDPIDLSQSAVMLAALSSVSSKPSEGSTISNAQERSGPNPDLVAFLRAYLAALEAQEIDEKSEEKSFTTQPNEPPVSIPMDSQTLTADPIPQTEVQTNVADKENWKPPRPTQYSKDQESGGSTNTSPLGLGRFNSRISSGLSSPSPNLKPNIPSSNTAETNETVTAVAFSSETSKKRKRSDVQVVDEDPQARRRPSISMKHIAPVEDLSGIRVNTGWGGLRLRADGSFGGGHPLKPPNNDPPAEANSTSIHQPIFFRSTSTAATVRKGPYVVPDWARGVPPPAPPPRPDAFKEDKELESNKWRKQGRSDGLRRLGGKTNVKREVSASKASGALNVSSTPVSPTPLSQKESSSLRSPCPSPNRTPPGKLPIFAHSSPVAKTSLATLFQAFQTSPCRPGADRKALLSTPRKSISATSPEGSGKHSSLFTPSPDTTSLDTESRRQTLFARVDSPPSPTPLKRNSPKALTTLGGAQQLVVPLSTGSSHQSRYEDDNPPSSLPIASSDDVTNECISLPEQSASSDSTIMDPNKFHDWSSLDLPPSSPPPPSSPSIAPTDGSDLPCSDIPSSDMSEGETPPIANDVDDHPSPYASEDQTSTHEGNLAMSFDLGFPNMVGIFSDPAFSDFDLPLAGQSGSAADAAIGALRNGLGQEDLSEAWSLLDDVLNPTPTNSDMTMDSQMQSWLAGSTFEGFDFGGLGGESNLTESADTGSNERDYASLMATNFEELLKGCLV